MRRITEHQAYMTRTLADACEKDAELDAAVKDAYIKFCVCNWGDTHPDDAKLNDEALTAEAGRIVAKYKMPAGSPDDLFIIMTFDEPSLHANAATIMFCSDY